MPERAQSTHVSKFGPPLRVRGYGPARDLYPDKGMADIRRNRVSIEANCNDVSKKG